MIKNILLTGAPRSGKSTLLKRIIREVDQKVGCVTSEVLKDNVRVGFEMETHSGKKAVIAHVDFVTPVQVSKYFIDIAALESLLQDLHDYKSEDLLYLDEIGAMQLYSDKFKELATNFLDSPSASICSFKLDYDHPFIHDLRMRTDSVIFEINRDNRDRVEFEILQIMDKLFPKY